MGHERRAARAAEPADRVEAPLGVESLDDLGRAARHRLDRRAAVAGRRQLGYVGAGGGRDLLAGHVGRRERLADDPRVDEEHVDAVLTDPLGEEGVLLALRVERSDEDDGRHVNSSSLAVWRRDDRHEARGSTPR